MYPCNKWIVLTTAVVLSLLSGTEVAGQALGPHQPIKFASKFPWRPVNLAEVEKAIHPTKPQLPTVPQAPPKPPAAVAPRNQQPYDVNERGMPLAGSFAFLTGLEYAANTLKSFQTNDKEACALQCHMGCDFVTYYAPSRTCSLKYTDKSARHVTAVKGQTSGFYMGELICSNPQSKDCVLGELTTRTRDECKNSCGQDQACHYVVMWKRGEGNFLCRRGKFIQSQGMFLGFRKNGLPLNARPATMGRFDVLGSSGVVGMHTNLLPNGRVLFTARPEGKRGGPNQEMVVRQQVPFGEIASVFDPGSGKFFASQVDDNVFCHGALLMADGSIFMTGGDAGNAVGGAAKGLLDGLHKQRIYDYTKNQWRYENDMLRPRWYPSVIRTPEGSVFVFGGATVGGGNEPQRNLEIYRPGKGNQYLESPLLARTGGAWYPQVALIPGTGNIFLFAISRWAILDYKTGQEVETDTEPIQGLHTQDYPTGATFLGLKPENGYRGEYVVFGGANNAKDQVAMDTVARITLNQQGPKKWAYDNGRMPYGRVTSQAVLQPNGKILLFNGAQLGHTGGDVGKPTMKASATDVFCYDPDAKDGQRFQVFAFSPIQRLYHSTAILLPDGRSLIAGTDQAMFAQDANAYEHRVEAFTPPWLLNGSVRPFIQSVPTGTIRYGSKFQVRYSGKVTRASLVTPGANTHGVEFSQRLIFLTIVQNGNGQVTLQAPPDATIALQGHHMLFLLNGDTPSVSKMIHLS